jgi:hypothetical protein
MVNKATMRTSRQLLSQFLSLKRKSGMVEERLIECLPINFGIKPKMRKIHRKIIMATTRARRVDAKAKSIMESTEETMRARRVDVMAKSITKMRTKVKWASAQY